METNSRRNSSMLGQDSSKLEYYVVDGELVPVPVVEESVELAGNPDVLRRYWREDPDNLVNWDNESGNLTRCHDALMEHANFDSEQAWGYCSERYQEKYGVTNAEREAKLGKEKKSKLSAETEEFKANTEKGQHHQVCSVCDTPYLGREPGTCSAKCRMKKSRQGD